MPLPQYLPYARFLLDTDLSHTAKLLYTLLLDRATLSQKNNWMDAQGRIYVVYPLSKLSKDLRYSVSSVTRAFAELENAQLVERIRSGFSKPSRILLKVPGYYARIALSQCAKCTPNQQRNKNHLKNSHLTRATDAHLTFGEYQNVFLTAKEYRRLKADFSGLDDLIEQLSAYIQSTGKKVRRPRRHPAYLGKAAENRTKIDTGHPGLHIQGRRKPIKTIEKILEQLRIQYSRKYQKIIMARTVCFTAENVTRPKEAFFAKALP
ncbi:MAG: replication initiator protein A [Subdoligranulum sp.]